MLQCIEKPQQNKQYTPNKNRKTDRLTLALLTFLLYFANLEVALLLRYSYDEEEEDRQTDRQKEHSKMKEITKMRCVYGFMLCVFE